MIRKLCAPFVLTILMINILSNLAIAQSADSWVVTGQHQYVTPIGSLAKWFKPTSTFSLAIGKQTSERWAWKVKSEIIQYRKENTEELYHKDLELELVIYGACAQASYDLLKTTSIFQPFLTGGAGLYRWFGHRGAYQLSEVLVPKRDQDDWSWGFNIGAGVNIFAIRNLAITLESSYQIIIGELWPALALRLENVSGFQSLNGTIGLTVFF